VARGRRPAGDSAGDRSAGDSVPIYRRMLAMMLGILRGETGRQTDRERERDSGSDDELESLVADKEISWEMESVGAVHLMAGNMKACDCSFLVSSERVGVRIN